MRSSLFLVWCVNPLIRPSVSPPVRRYSLGPRSYNMHCKLARSFDHWLAGFRAFPSRLPSTGKNWAASEKCGREIESERRRASAIQPRTKSACSLSLFIRTLNLSYRICMYVGLSLSGENVRVSERVSKRSLRCPAIRASCSLLHPTSEPNRT